MNEAARKTWEMMQNRTDDPLSPVNIETTRAAFPIALDSVVIDKLAEAQHAN